MSDGDWLERLDDGPLSGATPVPRVRITRTDSPEPGLAIKLQCPEGYSVVVAATPSGCSARRVAPSRSASTPPGIGVMRALPWFWFIGDTPPRGEREDQDPPWY